MNKIQNSKIALLLGLFSLFGMASISADEKDYKISVFGKDVTIKAEENKLGEKTLQDLLTAISQNDDIKSKKFTKLFLGKEEIAINDDNKAKPLSTWSIVAGSKLTEKAEDPKDGDKKPFYKTGLGIAVIAGGVLTLLGGIGAAVYFLVLNKEGEEVQA